MRVRFFGPLLLLLSLLIGVGAGNARAQSEAAGLARLEVALWPEYDRPEVLVVYRAAVNLNTPMPTTVELPIPAGVGEPHAVAKRGADNRLYTAEFERVDGPAGTALIRITTDQPRVQLEYYAPLSMNGRARAISFEWPGGPALGSLGYEVQEPAGATNFTLDPASTSQFKGNRGLTYYKGELGAVAANAKATIRVSYTKQSRDLSALPPTAGISNAPPVDLKANKSPPATAPPADGVLELAPPAAVSDPGLGLAWPVTVMLLLLAALTFGVQRAYAGARDARLSTARPGFYGAIAGMLAGLGLAGFGAWGVGIHADEHLLLSVSVLVAGVVEAVVCYYALRKSRPAWAFALSVNGTAFVIFLVGAPKLRDGFDLSNLMSVAPCVYFLAITILLQLSSSDYG